MKRFLWIFLLLFALPVAAQQAAAQEAAQETTIALHTPDTALEMGDEFTVDVQLNATPELYGYEIQLAFDPAVVEVRDADDGVSGIQIVAGSLFADEGATFLLENSADNTVGTITYAIVLVNPAPPVAGSGTLLSIPFRAKADGAVDLHITASTLGTKQVTHIPHTIAPSDLHIGTTATFLYFYIGVALLLVCGGLLLLLTYRRRTPPPPPPQTVPQGA